MRSCTSARSALFTAVLALTVTSGLLFPHRAAAQIDAGYLANWTDREIRVQDQAQSGEVSATLALIPDGGPEGKPPVLLIFEARWPRGGDQELTMLEVRTYLAPQADLRMHNRPVDLRFEVESDTGRRVPLYFYGSNWGTFGFIPPGDIVPVVRFAMTPSDLRAIVAAQGVSGEAMGYTFTLAPAQLDALRQFAKTAGLDEGTSTP